MEILGHCLDTNSPWHCVEGTAGPHVLHSAGTHVLACSKGRQHGPRSSPGLATGIASLELPLPIPGDLEQRVREPGQFSDSTFPCPGRYPEGELGVRPRHASPAPPVRLAAGPLQEEHPARAGLAHHHHRGHRRDGVRHPQRGESAAPTAPPPGRGVTLCQPCALFFPQDEKNQVLTTYIWYRQVSRGDLCQLPLSLRPGCCSRGWSTGGDWAVCLPAGHDCPGGAHGGRQAVVTQPRCLPTLTSQFLALEKRPGVVAPLAALDAGMQESHGALNSALKRRKSPLCAHSLPLPSPLSPNAAPLSAQLLAHLCGFSSL